MQSAGAVPQPHRAELMSPYPLLARPPQVVTAVVLSGFIAAAGVLGMATLSPEPRSSTVVLLDAILVGLCIFPGVLWFIGTRRRVPAFEAICLAHAAYFGVSGLLLPNEFIGHFTDAGSLIVFNEDELATTLLAVIAGVIALQVGYALVIVTGLERTLPAVDIQLKKQRLHTYLIVAVLGGLLLAGARGLGFTPASESSVGAVLNVFANQLNVAVGILSYLVFGGRRQPHIYLLLLVIAVLGGAWLGLTTTMLENVLLIPATIGIIALQNRRQFMLPVLGLLACGYLFLFQPVKLEYRTRLVNSLTELSYAERMGLWYEATRTFLGRFDISESPIEVTTDAELLATGRTSLERLDYIHQFELMRVDTPDMIPYYGGATYRYFVVGWIPRLLWPDKPSALEDNNRMILDYGILSDRSQQTTTAGVGWLPEAYANFGDFGMIVVMAIQGAVLAIACRAFTATASIGAQAVLLSVLIFLINGVGGVTTIIYGGLFQNLAANALLLWVVAGRAGRATTAIPPSMPRPLIEPAVHRVR